MPALRGAGAQRTHPPGGHAPRLMRQVGLNPLAAALPQPQSDRRTAPLARCRVGPLVAPTPLARPPVTAGR